MTDYANHHIATGARQGASLGWLASLQDTWLRYRVFRRTFDELNSLSTRDLDDLGISRSMITRLAYEAAYGKKA